MQAQVFLTNSNSIPFPQHDLPTHKHLFRSLALGCIKEYFWVAHVLAPFFPTPTSFDTTSTFTALHPNLDGYFPLFFNDYKLDQDLIFFLFPLS